MALNNNVLPAGRHGMNIGRADMGHAPGIWYLARGIIRRKKASAVPLKGAGLVATDATNTLAR